LTGHDDLDARPTPENKWLHRHPGGVRPRPQIQMEACRHHPVRTDLWPCCPSATGASRLRSTAPLPVGLAAGTAARWATFGLAAQAKSPPDRHVARRRQLLVEKQTVAMADRQQSPLGGRRPTDW